MYTQVYIWCSGEVVEVANGKTTKKSSRYKSPLPCVGRGTDPLARLMCAL